MNVSPSVFLTLFAAAAALALLGRYAAGRMRMRRRAGRDAVLGTRYLQTILAACMAGDDAPVRFPLLGRPGTRMILAETLAGLGSVTCGLDDRPIRRAVAASGLDRWLLRRARRSGGYRRARMLSLLSRLPVGRETARQAARYLGSRNRDVRFRALVVQLAADPASALRRMGEYDAPFSAADVAEIMGLLRRGLLPIAYGPLLTSPRSNLRRVGLGIVRLFGVEEAAAQLLYMAGCEEEPDLGREALYALCAMRRPLCRVEVAARIARMSEAERRSLLRRMAHEGYSAKTLRRLFEAAERPYYETLVQSYKRSLA